VATLVRLQIDWQKAMFTEQMVAGNHNFLNAELFFHVERLSTQFRATRQAPAPSLRLGFAYQVAFVQLFDQYILHLQRSAAPPFPEGDP